MRLVGTTKSTIDSVRESTHWNAANLAAMDPVTLGLCSQIDLDLEVKRASKGSVGPDEMNDGTTLMTAEEAMSRSGAAWPKRRERPRFRHWRQSRPRASGRVRRRFGVCQAQIGQERHR